MIIYCLSYAHDIMIWISRSLDLHSDNIITTTTTTIIARTAENLPGVCSGESAIGRKGMQIQRSHTSNFIKMLGAHNHLLGGGGSKLMYSSLDL